MALTIINATITATSSESLALVGIVPTGLVLSVAFTGTELSFTGSTNGTDFYVLKDESGGAVTLPLTGSSGYYNLNEEQFVNCLYLKIISNGTEASPRAVQLIVRHF